LFLFVVFKSCYKGTLFFYYHKEKQSLFFISCKERTKNNNARKIYVRFILLIEKKCVTLRSESKLRA